MCINCGGEHSANYRGCTQAKQYVQKITHRTQPRGASVHQTSHSNVRTGLSYSEVLGGKPNRQRASMTNRNQSEQRESSQQINNTENMFSALSGEVHKLFNTSLTEMMLKLRAFWPTYRETADLLKKQELMLNFLCSFMISP